MSSRIYFDDSLNRNADEFLEVAFLQLFHNNATDEDKAALASLLDPYTKICFGGAAVSFKGAFDSIERAKLWSGQFGKLHLWQGDDHQWYAKVEADHPENMMVSNELELNAILLAGVQFLREYSIRVLNPSPGENRM